MRRSQYKLVKLFLELNGNQPFSNFVAMIHNGSLQQKLDQLEITDPKKWAAL